MEHPMKAIVYRQYGSPDVLQVEEVERPTPGERDVLIRVGATAVSTAEMAFRKGDSMGVRLFGGLRRPKQTILGSEFAGEIAAVGSGVQRFRVGDRVFAATGAEFGADAEFVVLPEDGAIARVPEGVTHEQAAAVADGALTALPFLRDSGQIKAGQKVLVNGASGSVGVAAVQLAKHFGAEVTAVTSTRNVELVRSLGADHVIDYTQADFTAGDERYDLVFDTVGKSSFSQSRRVLVDGGVYLTTVLSPSILPRMLWTSKVGSRKAVITFTGLRKPEQKASDLRFLGELLASGAFRPIVDRSYPMGEAIEAHRYVETGHKRGAVVLTA